MLASGNKLNFTTSSGGKEKKKNATKMMRWLVDKEAKHFLQIILPFAHTGHTSSLPAATTTAPPPTLSNNFERGETRSGKKSATGNWRNF